MLFVEYIKLAYFKNRYCWIIYLYKNGDTMSIFTKVKEIDKYKGKTVVLNSIRTDKATAVKIDELVEVCTSEKGVKVSKNQLLAGIVTSFINGIETTAKTNEDKATQQLLEVLDN